MNKAQCRMTVLIIFMGTSAAIGQQQRGITAVGSETAIAAAQPGRYYALVVGINNYQHLPRLKTPLNDATEIASILSAQYGFQTRLLLDATRDQILGALSDYRGKLRENDNLLIYYAGHGYYDRDADQAYWFPVDAEKGNSARWIVATEITGQARAISARHVLVVSDSCYSGMLTRSVAPTFEDPRERDLYLEKMLRGKSRYVMSSGGDEPVADSDATGHASGHSVFANAFLQGLSQITLTEFSAEELFNQYVREQVGGRSKQLPEYNPIRDSGHDSGAFVFFRAHTAPLLPAGVSPAVKREVITPEAPPANPEAVAVIAAIHLYADAYASMDISELQKVWPSLSREQINELKKGFKGAQAVKVDLEDCDPAPAVNGETAEVSCDQSMAYTRDGKRQPAEKHPVDIRLRKSAGGTWLVDEVRTR